MTSRPGVVGSGPIIDLTTVLSLLSTVAILTAAWLLSRRYLPSNTTSKVRALFVWHAFDALIHTILEGSYLWNCFFSYKPIETIPDASRRASAYLPPMVHFLARSDRLYGAEYGTSPFSALWREYSKADARWQGTDLTVISLEMLTVFLGAPTGIWICRGLAKSAGSKSRAGGRAIDKPVSAPRVGPEWFWMIVLATGELYGGFMTFAPEWLSGSPNLDTSNALYLWVYLTFFNGLWVLIPAWVLYEAYMRVSGPGALVTGKQD